MIQWTDLAAAGHFRHYIAKRKTAMSTRTCPAMKNQSCKKDPINKSPTSGKAGGLMIGPQRANKNREAPKRAEFFINPNSGGMNHFLIKTFLSLSPPFTKGDLGGF